MKRRIRTVLLMLLGVVLVGGVIFELVKPKEPVYQGRRLRAWLAEADVEGRDNSPTAVKANEAVKQIGVKALPTLLNMITKRDLSLKNKFITFVQKYTGYRMPFTPDFIVQYQAAKGFIIIGKAAKPAIPQLSRMFCNTKRFMGYPSKRNLAWALGGIGPDSLDILVQGMTSTNQEICVNAMQGIGVLATFHFDDKSNTEAMHARQLVTQRVIPLFTSNLLDKVPSMRWTSAMVLGQIRLRPDIAIPALMDYLEKYPASLNDATYAVEALACFGPEASEAVPLILKTLNNSKDTWYKENIPRCLERIDWKAAKRWEAEQRLAPDKIKN